MSDAGDQVPGQEAEAPSSFQILCGSLVAQVQMALGLFPDPVDQKTRVEIGAAKQGIDMLVMLEEKTRGNLDEREEKFLTMLLTQLRMLFVDRVKELQETAQGADPEPGEGSEPSEEKPATDDGPTIITP